MICSCGESKSHVIARRLTSDGLRVQLWSDGSISGGFGALPGVPSRVPRDRDTALAAGWMFLGWVELYDREEIAGFYAACRWAAERGLDGAAARQRFARKPPLKPRWDVYQADRDGRPTLRVWKLPRLLGFGGLAVWDHCSSGRGGRYELVSYDRKSVCSTTGMRFATLAGLRDHLEAISP